MRTKATSATGAAAEAQPSQLSLPGGTGLPPEKDAEAKLEARIIAAKRIIEKHPQLSFEQAFQELNPLPRAAYTLKEAAKVIGISYISVYRLIERGKLKCSTALPGRKLIPVREVEAFLKR